MTLPPDFPWRRGMTAILPDGTRALVTSTCTPPGRSVEVLAEVGDEIVVVVWRITPDPNDGATLGALLAEVRRKHGLPDLYVKPLLPAGWVVTRPFTRPAIAWFDVWAPTEFDALLAAWNARPGKP